MEVAHQMSISWVGILIGGYWCRWGGDLGNVLPFINSY